MQEGTEGKGLCWEKSQRALTHLLGKKITPPKARDVRVPQKEVGCGV